MEAYVLSVVGFAVLFTGICVACPSDWVESEASGTCIKLFWDYVTWSEGRDKCQQEGGDLVKIINADMDAFIADQIEAAQEEVIYDTYWIGLHLDEDLNYFVWLDETIEAEYTNWYKEPGFGAYECAYMFSGHGTEWGVMMCTYAYYFYICEISGTATESYTTSFTTRTTAIQTASKGQTVEQTTDGIISDPNGGDSASSAGLSTGAVAAIVVICVVVAVAPVVFFTLRSYRRRQSKVPTRPNDVVAFVAHDYTRRPAVNF